MWQLVGASNRVRSVKTPGTQQREICSWQNLYNVDTYLRIALLTGCCVYMSHLQSCLVEYFSIRLCVPTRTKRWLLGGKSVSVRKCGKPFLAVRCEVIPLRCCSNVWVNHTTLMLQNEFFLLRSHLQFCVKRKGISANSHASVTGFEGKLWPMWTRNHCIFSALEIIRARAESRSMWIIIGGQYFMEAYKRWTQSTKGSIQT